MYLNYSAASLWQALAHCFRALCNAGVEIDGSSFRRKATPVGPVVCSEFGDVPDSLESPTRSHRIGFRNLEICSIITAFSLLRSVVRASRITIGYVPFARRLAQHDIRNDVPFRITALVDKHVMPQQATIIMSLPSTSVGVGKLSSLASKSLPRTWPGQSLPDSRLRGDPGPWGKPATVLP